VAGARGASQSPGWEPGAGQSWAAGYQWAWRELRKTWLV